MIQDIMLQRLKEVEQWIETNCPVWPMFRRL